ncbi:unnamed protein product [Vitrella brassicaformis CCMP3155]|uniref:Importin subunit alpha n=1 Tax=Vitrella brassicaformis (strain CCMP3155) TaxID=1169540 RepID=A0A0G4FKC3_VITBC|nr:unnamed protein product [Vitrella brassicaformis CCMP3155]|eukprot:CEM14167.1 unnamed protein product [Vitrella brassicaformis CCMP3155]
MADSTADAASTPADHPSPQAVLAKAGKLFDAIGTQEAYDKTVQQRGSEAVEAEITAVMTDLCHLMASASDPQLKRTDVIRQLLQLLCVEHMDGTMDRKAVNADAVPVLVEQLRCSETQGPAAWAISVLAMRNGDLVVDAGAIQPLVQLVSSSDDYVRLGAIGALDKVAAESVSRRDAVLAAGVLQPLLKAMRESTSDADVLYLGAELLINLWSVRPLPVPLAECAPFLPVLVGLISKPEQDDSVLRSARGALGHFGMLSIEAHGTDADRDALVECGATASIKALLESAEPQMKGVACLLVMFLAGGTTSHRQAVIDGGLVPLLVRAAARGETHVQQKQTAARTIETLSPEDRRNRSSMWLSVAASSPSVTCSIAATTRATTSPQVSRSLCCYRYSGSAGRQKEANEGLPDNPYCALLEQAGGVDKVAELQTHNHMGIATLSIGILAAHFPGRVDAQRLQAVQAAMQAAGQQEGDGVDDVDTDASGGSDSDGEDDAEGDPAGQLGGDGEQGGI